MKTEQIINDIDRTFFVNADEDKFFKEKFGGRPYQLRNLKFLRKCCPVKPVIIDVGMHIGQNTIEYATWASEVHGFEPCKSSFELAKKNIECNQQHWSKDKYWWYLNSPGSLQLTGKVKLYNVGLGNKNENVYLEHSKNTGHNKIVIKPNNNSEMVEIRILDSYKFNNIDIIKIDVEGYELFVLEGAKNTIKRCRPVIQLEVNENHLKNFNVTPEQLFEFFDDNYVFCSYKGTLMQDYYVSSIGVSDYFFIPGDLYDVLDKKVLMEQKLMNREKFKTGLIRNSRFYEVYDDVVMKGDKIKLRI